KKATSVGEFNEDIMASANGMLKGILGYTDEPLVSRDFNHDSLSSILATDQTKVMEGYFVRVLSWYVNEWGFSSRMSD
ncbi:erythrose-4-phosphate dehydrogenase, partial [Rhizobium ruizarguesonis]